MEKQKKRKHSSGEKHWVMDYSQNSGKGVLSLASQSEMKMKITKAKEKIIFPGNKIESARTKAVERSVHTGKFH